MHVQQKQLDQDSLSYLATRNDEAYKLISEIMGNIQTVEGCPDVKSVLPYCEIIIKTPMEDGDDQKAKTSYVLMKGQNNSGPNKSITFHKFEQLVAYILQKWW